MAIIKITIENKNRILNAFRQAPELMAKKLQETLFKAGGMISGEVKKHITLGTNMWKPPIRTGAMRRGIAVVSSSQNRVVIKPSNITYYAFYVHEGTKFMRGRPFFEITAKQSQKTIESFINKELDSAVREIARRAG
jgi:HK97 gp10 family phage protein